MPPLAEIDEVGVVVTAATFVAPLSGARACAIHLEAMRDGVVLATTTLGDLLRVRTPRGDIDLLVRRATFAFLTRFDAPDPLRDPVPPELVPLLRHRPDGFRERCILPGDRFRVRATVEAQFREDDGALPLFVASDRSLIRLEEALSLTF